MVFMVAALDGGTATKFKPENAGILGHRSTRINANALRTEDRYGAENALATTRWMS
jgi:hypothetical protein